VAALELPLSPENPGTVSVSQNSWRFCGRDFSWSEMQWIQSLIAGTDLNRSQLARRVCEQLHWVNPAGQLKAMSCRVAMLRMERAGLMELPKPSHRDSNRSRRPLELVVSPSERLPGQKVLGHKSLRLELVQNASARRSYQALMEQHHCLGYKPLAGAQLRYLIWNQNGLVGGLGFGAAAWSIAARDRWIGWPPVQRERQLHRVVNNNRFLILPWMRAPNVASCVLGKAARQLPRDWEERYDYRPVLLESFVDQERFSGCSYRAASWLCVGQTQGRGKLEKHHRQILPIKWVFVYPLRADFRNLLNP
jgi:uncharacterized protein DUF4338